jgi:hypothetical protein
MYTPHITHSNVQYIFIICSLLTRKLYVNASSHRPGQQHTCWAFKSSGIVCCVIESVVPHVLKDDCAFTFKRPAGQEDRRKPLTQRHNVTSQKIWILNNNTTTRNTNITILLNFAHQILPILHEAWINLWTFFWQHRIWKGRHLSDPCTSTVIDLMCILATSFNDMSLSPSNQMPEHNSKMRYK